MQILLSSHRPQATRKPCLKSHNRVHGRKLVRVEGGDCSKRSIFFFPDRASFVSFPQLVSFYAPGFFLRPLVATVHRFVPFREKKRRKTMRKHEHRVVLLSGLVQFDFSRRLENSWRCPGGPSRRVRAEVGADATEPLAPLGLGTGSFNFGVSWKPRGSSNRFLMLSIDVSWECTGSGIVQQ